MEQELPDGPVEFVLQAMRSVLDLTGEAAVRITSLQVAMLADELLKQGVVFPHDAVAGLPELRAEDLQWTPLYVDGQWPNEQPRGGILRHKPSGLEEVAASERTQLQNRAVALRLLRARVARLRDDLTH